MGITEHIQNTAVGLLIEKEMKYLSNTLIAPPRPTVLILGGSKISDKIELIENMINKDKSLSRYSDFNEYKNNSRRFLKC